MSSTTRSPLLATSSLSMLLLLLLTTLVILVKGCRISEFYCDNGQCVGLDKFCDGNRDCQDGSDETRFCSRCNRTYYGDRHKTYRLDITKPSPGKLPYICALTFMAGGGDLGDIVELSFERFNLGHLEVQSTSSSFNKNNNNHNNNNNNNSNNDKVAKCVGSYMQILERNMDWRTSGRWCSPITSMAPVYYSESNNVTVLLTIVDDQLIQFGLKFRYIAKHDSVTRYGQSHTQYHRGELVPNSICDRIFQDCDSQPCKIQSPNFPGLYPRNVTCLLQVTQRTIPRGKHAFIVLKQPNEDKLSIKADTSLGITTVRGGASGGGGDIAYHLEKKLMFGDKCIHDYVTVYDGSDARYSTPLARFCHGGALAPIISSGPEVVVEFHTASADILEMHSFELDVEVMFFPENDIGLRMLGPKCEFILDANERSSGMIHSLRHLASPNTSCSYLFRGRRHDIVWLYFVKYFVDGRGGFNNNGGGGGGGGLERSYGDRTIQGELYDGSSSADTHQQSASENITSTLLTKFDDDNGLKLCVHARNFPNFVPLRPCRHPIESYLSSGSDLFLRYNFTSRFNLRYLHMEGRYEFIDTYQDGEPNGHSSNSFSCQRVFRSQRRPEGSFSSPKNLFLYGRGGRSSLSCSYTFIAQPTETIRLTFRKLRMGNRKCKSYYDIQSNRRVCLQSGRSDQTSSSSLDTSSGSSSGSLHPIAELKISQILWNKIEVPIACVCQLEQPFTVDLMAHVANVNFTITEMTSLEDFDSFLFEANYEFLSSVHCKEPEHVLVGTTGHVSVSADRTDLRDGPTRIKCPWLLTADANQFVHLRIVGITSLESCNTDNRIVVFSADELEPLVVVCPMTSRGSLDVGNVFATMSPADLSQSNEVEVHTKSWNKSTTGVRGRARLSANTLIVELHASEPGRFDFKWMRGDKSQASKLLGRKSRSDEDCVPKCADNDENGEGDDDDQDDHEDDDCLSSFNFWCDRIKSQCSGDRDGGGGGGRGCRRPSSRAHFPWIYVAIGVGCGVLVTVVLVMSLLHRLREIKAKKGKPIPTDEYSMDGKEIDC